MDQLIASMVAGALGANVLGKLVRGMDLGLAANAIVGILGGAGATLALGAALGVAPEGGAISDGMVSGAAGGGIAVAAIGLLRRALGR